MIRGARKGARIVSTSEATTAAWRAAYAADPDATFFHGPDWAEIWQTLTDGRYRPAPRIARFADGRSAILGITEERTRLGVRSHLSPAGTYGGWVGGGELGLAQAHALAAEIARLPSVLWRVAPRAVELVPPRLRGAAAEPTHVIDLGDGAGRARGHWKSAARRQSARALREGTRVRRAMSLADWLAYAELYDETRRRWARASSSYDLSLFAVLYERSSPEIQLWLAEAEQGPVAGAVVFVHGAHAVWWHGASSRRGPGSANLLHWEVLGELALQGLRTYDLSPSAGHEGVARFKETLGGTPLPSLFVRRRRMREGVAESVRRARPRSAGAAS